MANPGFQLSLDVKGRLCLVIGGDEEAADKAERLLEAGAKVTVVHPTLHDRLKKLAAAAKIIHRGRTFRSSDAEGVTLVLNTLRTDDDYAKSLYDLAQKERFLLCSIDRPEYSTCMMPALVSRGHLRLAVSTSGVAPALASRLRQDLEALFDEEFQAFLSWLEGQREKLQQAQDDAEVRRRALRDTVEGFRLSGSLTYPHHWADQRGGRSGP
jgi:precorrin-2 dehydrogenase/sirohydrochlorin ferrochelatase